MVYSSIARNVQRNRAVALIGEYSDKMATS